ncbi:MAG: nuclear transport factor 2 family protein [Bacteroidales bacterium]|nr:MAG: nuclear transport factor 2 family protein [Bacteroidales bacterium]
MKKLTVVTGLCILMFLAVNTVYAQKLSEKQRIKIENELESVFEEALKTGESLDADKLMVSVDDKYKAGHLVNGIYYSSFDTVMTIFKSGIKNLERQEYDIHKKKITVLTKNLAIISASGIAKIYTYTGGSFNSTFAWTFVYEKTGEGWKVIHSHRSNPR